MVIDGPKLAEYFVVIHEYCQQYSCGRLSPFILHYSPLVVLVTQCVTCHDVIVGCFCYFTNILSRRFIVSKDTIDINGL
jgi:hypothetical protein